MALLEWPALDYSTTLPHLNSLSLLALSMMIRLVEVEFSFDSLFPFVVQLNTPKQGSGANLWPSLLWKKKMQTAL